MSTSSTNTGVRGKAWAPIPSLPTLCRSPSSSLLLLPLPSSHRTLPSQYCECSGRTTWSWYVVHVSPADTAAAAAVTPLLPPAATKQPCDEPESESESEPESESEAAPLLELASSMESPSPLSAAPATLIASNSRLASSTSGTRTLCFEAVARRGGLRWGSYSTESFRMGLFSPGSALVTAHRCEQARTHAPRGKSRGGEGT